MKRIILPLVILGSLITSCNNNDSKDETETPTSVVLKDQSVTPSLLKAQAGFESLKIYSLLVQMMYFRTVRNLFLEVLQMVQVY